MTDLVARMSAHQRLSRCPDQSLSSESRSPANRLANDMVLGNMPTDGGHILLLTPDELSARADALRRARFVRASDFVRLGGVHQRQGSDTASGSKIDDADGRSSACAVIADRLAGRAANSQRQSDAASTQAYADSPHRFVQIARCAQSDRIDRCHVVRRRSRQYLPVGLVDEQHDH